MNEDDIRDFLVQNPDYFQQNPELLGLLQIPHGSGEAVSLVERQVSVLRERNVDLRHRLRELGSTARGNDQLFADTRALVLALLEAGDARELEQALLRVLRDSFDVEYAALLLFADGDSTPGQRHVPESQARGRLAGILNQRIAGCGPLRAEEFEFLFPGARVQGSAAVRSGNGITVFVSKKPGAVVGHCYLQEVQELVDYGIKNVVGFRENDISDGYHTFGELYGFRMAYHALLFNEWAKKSVDGRGLNPYGVHKSWRHHDGEECFPDSEHKWFIVSAVLPTGQVSNHYKAEHWDKFRVPEEDLCRYEWDGHTSKDVLERLNGML